MLLAVFTVAIQLGWFDAVVCTFAIGALLLILGGRAGFLRHAPLVWLGTISYSLYLLHNYAGRSIIAILQASGWSANSPILAVTLLTIGSAALLTFTIRQAGAPCNTLMVEPAAQRRAAGDRWLASRTRGQPHAGGRA